MKVQPRKKPRMRVNWRIAFISLCIATSIWYYVRFAAIDSSHTCIKPLFPDEIDVLDYNDCLERRRVSSKASSEDTGILP